MAKSKHGMLTSIRKAIKARQLFKKIYAGGFLIELFTSDFDNWIRISGGGAVELIFTVDSAAGSTIWSWAGGAKAKSALNVDHSALTATEIFTYRLTNFVSKSGLYQAFSDVLNPAWGCEATVDLNATTGKLTGKAAPLPEFATGETVLPYELIHTLTDGRQFVYCGPFDFSKAGGDAFWYERSQEDGLLRELFVLPLTPKTDLAGDLYWPARGWDSRDYASVTPTAIYIRGAFGDDKGFPASSQVYYELWKWEVTAPIPIEPPTDPSVHTPSVVTGPSLITTWFGTRSTLKYQFHSFLFDPTGSEGGYVETHYTTPGVPPTYEDTGNFFVFGGVEFSLDFAVLLGYTRVENTGSRFVRFWKIRDGKYGVHLRNFVNHIDDGDVINDAFISWELAEPEDWNEELNGPWQQVVVVYKVPENRATSVVRGGSVVNQTKPEKVFFAESDRVGLFDSTPQTNFVSYVLNMDTGALVVVNRGEEPTNAAWVV